MNKKVAFYTLGCKLNFSETSTIADEFAQGGFTRAVKGETADICVINTCSVTADADKKCRNIVRKAIKDHPQAIVAVTGCYAQLKPQGVAEIEGVSIVLGNEAKGGLVSEVLRFNTSQVVNHCEAAEISNFFAAFSSGDRTRSFLKVQDGCDYLCSYCTIPLARGRSRNASIADLTAAAQEIARRGKREIVLTGVNIGDFGRSTGESFLDLLRSLDTVEGIDRYRISSIEPNLLTDRVIGFCADSTKFQPHFHIPLQAGTNKMLAAMKRRYTTEKFTERIAYVRQRMKNAFIGIDIIVGFPGESDADFEYTMQYLRFLKPSYLHIFPYSERADTPAINLPMKVSSAKKQARVRQLEAMNETYHREFCERFIGKEVSILVESANKNGRMYGFTEHYVRVELPYDSTKINTIVRAKITAINPDGNAITTLDDQP